ncbi:MAG: FG-GAP repeat protein, partial [Desulfopila sp.]|nr:FG-GAP repeat protein [Desulfopila sp.]
YALAAGDFDGNGYVDLAIGAPYESVGAVAQAGIVHVLYSTTSGLSATGSQGWYQGYSGLQGSAETGDRFGYALAAIPLEKNGGLFFPIRAQNGTTVIIHLE